MASAPIAANQLDVVLRNVADGITAQRADGSLAYANDAAARLLGLESGDEMLALTGAELLERVAIIGEDGAPPAPDELPNRRALTTKRAEEGTVAYRLLPDGEERWSFVRSTPILTADGEVDLVINVIHDVTAERVAQERARLVAETGAVFAASIDVEATFDALASLLVPRFADYCIVDMFDETGPLRQVVIAHRDPEREELLRELRLRYPPDDNPAHPVSQVRRTRQPYLIADAREDALAQAAVDEEHLTLYRRLDATSYIVVPLEARGRLLGTISLGTGESKRQFDEADLSLAHELSRRAALAIDNALLFDTAQQSYAQLNTLLVSAPVGIGFWDRDLRFVRVNDALAAINGLTPEEHVGRELGEVVGELAPVLVPLYQRVLETGEPVVHTESTADAALQMGERRHWLSSYYPVHTADGEVIGIGAVIMEITDRKRADDRLRLLAEAGELFSSSLEQDEIAARIARVGVPRLADTCNVYVDRDGVLVRVACVAAYPAVQPVLESLPSTFALQGEVGQVANVYRQGEPLLLRTVPDDYLDELERHGADRRAFEQIGTRSLMLVPIVSGGETAGILTLGSRIADRFDEHDLDLAQELAGRAGVAMENARLVGELRRRAQAAQALEFVGDGVFLVDRRGVVRLWNPDHGPAGGAGRRRQRRGRPPGLAAGAGGAAADVPGREPRRGALALADRGRVPERRRLRLPRPDRGARRRAAEERLRLDRLARAADAAGRHLRRRDDAPARGRPAQRGAGGRDARRDRGRVRAARPDRQRHPAREPARLGRADGRDRPHERDGAGARRARRRRGPSARGDRAGAALPGARAAGRGRPGRPPPGARQPGRERDQVLAERRPRRARARSDRRSRPLRRPRPRARDSAVRAGADLREVLPPRPQPLPRRRRHGARALHLPRDRPPHGRPDPRRVRAGARLDLLVRAAPGVKRLLPPLGLLAAAAAGIALLAWAPW
ncbi:MAG: PAS domain-containing protein, partial [Thermoleophilia bacterium]|nr:PAS domain-containing protein [Thermoleophilia bacterium]